MALWAELLRVSWQVVYARCNRAGLKPKACLDLGRAARAIVVHRDSGLPLSEIFACLDGRSAQALLARGGITESDLGSLGLRQLLARQLFVRRQPVVGAFLKNLEQIPDEKLQRILRTF